MKQPLHPILPNLRFLLVWLALLAAPYMAASQDWDQVLKAVATDAATDDQLGISVAINGDYAVVGAWMDNFTGATDAGSAYFFQRIGGVWTFVQKVSASDRSANDHFGFSVSISGTYAIVGAPDDDHSIATANAGSAYVFELIAGTWTQVEKLRSSDEDFGGRFGSSVSISGDYAVVGARNNDLVAGDAFVFRRNGLNDWVQMQQINSADRAVGDQFGFSVAIDGTYIVVGSNMADIGSDGNAGAAYFFELIAGSWTQVEKVVASDPDDDGHFGNAVAINGIYAVVGAPGEDSDDGQAYIFKRLGLNDWALDEAIVSDDVSTDDHFGDAVAISGKVVLVGALDDNIEGVLDAGSAYFFELQCDDTWSQTQKVTASDFNLLNYFGTSIGISGQHALVGAPLASIPGGLIAGAAYFFSTETLCEVVGKYTGTAPYDTRMDFDGLPVTGEVCTGAEIEVDVLLASPDGWGVEGTDFRFEVTSVTYNGVIGSVGYTNGTVVSKIQETLTNNTGGPITVTYNLAIRQLDCGEPIGDLCGNRSFEITVNPEPEGANDTKTIYTCTAVDYNLQDNVDNLGNGVESDFTWYSVEGVGSSTAKNNIYVEGESVSEQAGDVITDVLTNLTNAPQTIFYKVFPANSEDCEGEPFWISVTVRPKEKFDCIGCGSKINVTLGAEDCSAEVTLNMVLLNVAACAASKNIPASLIYEALEVVVDDGVGADNIVTCPGQHKYVVRLKPGYERCLIWQPCWGVVNAEDKSAPLYKGYYAKCTGVYQESGQQQTPNDPLFGGVKYLEEMNAAFLCVDAEKIFNVEGTWKNSGHEFFAGRPKYEDACHTGTCQCNTVLKATDQITYLTCEEYVRGGAVPEGYEGWAVIKRTFTATDCYGNFTQGYQLIYLVRPVGRELVGQVKDLLSELEASCDEEYAPQCGESMMDAEDRRRRDRDCCGELDYVLDLACLLEADKCVAPSAGEMIAKFKSLLALDNPFDCKDERSYALFPEGTGSLTELLACNYSFDVQIVNEFAVCDGGKKVLVKLSYFDWCNPEKSLEHCAYVLLKWYDNEAPEFADVRKVKYDEPARFCQDDFSLEERIAVSVISTGAMDCTAALAIDRQGLKEYLGWEITDNCDENPSVSVTRMERWGLQYAYGIPLGADSCWHEETYQVMVVGGRPVVTGLEPGLYRFTVEAFDHCYNKACQELYIRVVDKIAPVMKCDDQLNITLSNSQGSAYGQGYPAAGTGIYGYARVLAKDVDEGSWDNCGMDRIKIRRSYDADCQADFIAKGYDWDNNGKIEAGKDGIDENKDGSLSANEKFESVTRTGVTTVMTPWLDFAEFFCCDLGNKVIVELGGWDKSGNFNYCWSEQLIEDKVLPTYILPWPVTIKCTDRAYVEGLMTAAGSADGWDVTGDEYKNFVEKVLTDKGGVQNVLVTMSGNDCRNTAVKAKVTTDLHCEAGTVTVTYTYTKTTSKGTVTGTIGSVVITVQPVHEYNIMFPADLEGDCVNIRDTANVIDGGELSCDVLAVNVSDKRYNGATLNGAPVAECYKIFRTFTVINWCQYDEDCGDPMQWVVVVPRDPKGNGTNWNDGGGVNVLVRDKNMDRFEEIYYEDEDGNVAYPNDNVNWANKGGKTVSSDDVEASDLPQVPSNCGDSYGNNGNERFAFMYTQYIFVHDKVRPEVLEPDAFTFYQNKNSCNTTVSIEFSAQDLCSVNTEVQQVPAVGGNLAIERVKFNGGELPSWLTVAPAHALNGDDKGTNSWVVSGTGTSEQAPIGEHKLTVIVRDDCGNLSLAKDIPFTIADTNGIAPICYHGLSTDLMKNPDTGEGEMVIWATDFKASDVQDCNAKTVGVKENIPDNQYYVVKDSGADGVADGVWDSHDGLNEAGIPTSPQTSVTFTCADAKVTQVAVRLYTKDALGNWAWCETYAIVTDARKVCPSAAASAAIGGAISTENKESVEGVEVALSGHSSLTKVTNNAGEFGFSGVTLGYDYTVTPHLDKNALNGVSTFDLVLITKHILGVQPLNSPYKLIAADVNNSKSVTTLDLIQLRKLILGIDTKFVNNTSWRFVDRSFKFADPSNPWKSQFPEVANLNDLAADAKADFVAVKVGDVNGNAIANTIVRTAGVFNLKVEDQPLKAGNEYRIPFTGDVSQIEGYQFTLNYGQALELVDIEYGVAKAENFGVFERERLITASWNEAQGAGRKAQGETLFTLVVKAKADVASLSEVLNINSRITRAEAYRQGGDYLNVDLAIQPLNHLATQSLGFALNQNTPNPFQGETVIGFKLPAAGEATLTIQDVTGRTLRVVKGQFAQGYNQVTLKATELNATGVLSYTLKAGEYTATKKMIVLE